jgi:HEAT repeat protein
MKSFFGHSQLPNWRSLAVIVGLITVSACAERKETAPAASESQPAAMEAASSSETTPAAESTTAPESAKSSLPEISTVIELATTGSGVQRYTAIDDLGERAESPELVVPALMKMLNADDPQVVWRSVRTLGDFGPAAAAAAPELNDLLDSKDPILQYHAAIALGKIGDRSEDTVDELVEAVGSSDSRVSRAAVEALKELKPGPKKVAPAIKKALASNDTAVAVNAIDAIVEVGPPAVPLINEMLKDPSTAYIAAAAAEQMGPDAAEAVPALEELLGATKHSQLQIRVLLALGRIGPSAKSAEPQIVELMANSHDATVPVAAAFALGSIGATEADEPLKTATATDKPFLSMVAAWSLAKLHPDDAQLKQQALDKLNAGLKSDDENIKAAAEKGLKSLEATATTGAQ